MLLKLKNNWPFMWPYLAILLTSTISTYPLFSNIHNSGMSDRDFFCFADEVARDTILRYHQFPLWNPYSNGGRALLGHPQSAFLRPTFVLSFIFGCVVGQKLEVILMIFLGGAGMLLLSRHLGIGAAGGFVSATIFGLSSYHSLHIAEGHLPFLPFVFLPYVVLFYLKAFNQWKFIFLSTIFLVLTIFWGGIAHVFVPICLFLAIYGVLLSIQKRKLYPIFHFGAIVIIVFLVGAIKILPSYQYVEENPRITDSADEFTPLNGIRDIFFNTEQRLGTSYFTTDHYIQKYGWHEYGAYVGILSAVFFVFGLAYFWKQQLLLIISGFLAFVISLGDYGRWSPWILLHKLPIFNSMRVPSRFIIFSIFCIAILAGLATNLFWKDLKSSKSKYLLLAIVFLLAADLTRVNSHPLEQAFHNKPIEVGEIVRKDKFEQIFDTNPTRSGSHTSLYLNLLANQGTIHNYDSAPMRFSYAKHTNDLDYRGEVYLDGNGTSSYAYWSPNRLVVNVDVQSETRLVINQNYDKGWHVKGKAAENFNGLLSTIVTPADKTVEFYYLPVPFILGAIVTVVSIIFTIIFLRRP